MSGDVDPEDKAEEPTEKRLHDAVERGEVAFSREAPLFASLSAALLVLIFVIPTHAEALITALVGLIDDPAGWRIERGEDVLALAGPLVAAGMHSFCRRSFSSPLPVLSLRLPRARLALCPTESCPTPRVSRCARA